MNQRTPTRRAARRPPRLRTDLSQSLAACLLSSDAWESIQTNGYASLADSPDVAAAVGAIADVISSAPIYLMRNTPEGDVRERSELSRFMDIKPYSLGTRKSFISWIVQTMLTIGDGNAFVLPLTQDG